MQRLPEIGIRLAPVRAAGPSSPASSARGGNRRGRDSAGTASAAAGRALGSLLFDTRTTDPGTYALVATSVLLIAIVASLVPARRAMRVDPMTTLRN
jgi:hypothetical protein